MSPIINGTLANPNGDPRLPPESALADIAPFSSAAAEEKPTEFKADYDDRRVEYHVP
jgi:hypothetical protein